MLLSSQKEDLRAIFDQAYNSLNEAQKEAVKTIEGPVMVIAGPGTGKTQILTLRIANILLQTDTAPESILALTFTESGAKAMRSRLHRYIGARAYQVQIFTFHGFADKLIRDYPDAYAKIVGGRPAGEIEKISILETILDSTDIKFLRPAGDPSYYVKPILRMIGELKKEYIRPDNLATIILAQEVELDAMEKIHQKGAHKGKIKGDYSKKEQSINKNRELLSVYRQYESMLGSQKLYDFEDMISETVLALSCSEDMLRDLQEQYQYVLADEHQDVNGSQNKILELLASYHESPNIFVVGDEKQAIYRFQGASLQNFMYFQERFVGTKVISLTNNYRSGQLILDAAHSLVRVESGPLAALRIPLESKINQTGTLSVRSFSHQAVEDEWLVSDVLRQLESGITPEEIAVIVRTNREVETLAGALRKAGILVEASADGDILVHPITQAVEALVDVVFTDTDEAALFKILHGAYWGLSINDIVKITSARSYDSSLLSILSSREKLEFLNVDHVDAALKINEVINQAREKEVSEPPHRVLEYLLQASGFLDHVIAHDPFEGVRVIRRLYDEVESIVVSGGIGQLSVIRDMFALRRSYNLTLEAPYINTTQKSVQIMTAHKSKGLEFEVVYVPHLQDSVWGGGMTRTNFDIPLTKINVEEIDKYDDEKRLLYVAITRAKHQLHFSTSEINNQGKVLVPSRLLDDVDGQYITMVPVDDFEQVFNPVSKLNQLPHPISIDTNLILRTLSTRGFSATSLNNYLSNPWDYIYRNVLRIPEVQPTHMQFGTAVHAVLEFVTKHFSEHNKLPSDTIVKQKLETALGRMPLNTNEFVRLLDKGLNILYVYIEHLSKSLLHKTKEELNIKVTLATGLPEFPELILTGKLDRIDLNKNGEAMRVIDYKTGKYKTRNVIEGKTASSDGAYKRQLVFYALLLQLYGDERYLTNVGRLSFVEPDSKGVIHEEEFVVSAEEVEVLKQQIIQSLQEIIVGDFLTDQSLIQDSKYAHLVQLLPR